MKNLLIALIATLYGHLVQAQEVGISLSYQFINAGEWNRATQVYNYSRPFLQEKQPLLRHGLSIGGYYLFSSSGSLGWGPSINISLNRSAADNNAFDIAINSLLLDVGARLQYRPTGMDKLFASFTPSIIGLRLNRRLNGDIIEVEDGNYTWKIRSLGIGAGAQVQLGYDVSPAKSHYQFSPIVGFGFAPAIWGSRSEVVFNESAAGDLKQTTSLYRFNLGLLVKRR